MENIVKEQISNNGKYRIKVFYDESPWCPCTNWDMAGCFLFEYRDSHTLHDECNWRELFSNNRNSLEDALRALVYQYVDTKDIIKYIKEGNVDKYRMRYDRSDRRWYLEHYCFNEWYTHQQFYPSDLKNFDYTDELTEFMEQDDLITILNRYGKNVVINEFALRGYCQGDYIEGISYCDKERYAKYVNKNTKNWKAKAEEILEGELDSVNRWMWGDVYGYVLEEKRTFTKTYDNGEVVEDCEWEETDSCWGFFCDPDEVIAENLPNTESEMGMVG